MKIALSLTLYPVLVFAPFALAGEAVWKGASGNGNWKSGGNWEGKSPSNDDSLRFTGSNGLSNTNNEGALRIVGLTFDNAGAGDFTLNGNSLTLTGDLTSNRDGTQTINLPLVMIGSQTFNVSSGTVQLNGSFTSRNSAGINITKSGAGILVVNNSGSPGLSRIVSEGILEVQNFGFFAGGTSTTVTGGTLALRSNGASLVPSQNIFSLAGTGVAGKAALWNEAGMNTVSQSLTLNGTTSIGAATNTTLVIGQGGAGASGNSSEVLKITGAGTVRLGNSLTSLSQVTVDAGRLETNTYANLGGAALSIQSGATASFAETTGSHSFGSLSGSGNLILGNTTYGTYSIGSNNSSTSFGGSISGIGQIEKTGTGTFTLAPGTGLNMEAKLTVKSGEFVLNRNATFTNLTGNLGSITVDAGARFSGIGSANVAANRSVTVNGSHSAGTFGTSGAQAINGTLNYGAPSIFQWDLNSASTSSGFDRIIGNGSALSINSSSVFRIVIGDGVSSAAPFWSTDQTWAWEEIFTNFASSGYFNNSRLSVAGGPDSSMGSFSLTGSGVKWTSTGVAFVPEPTSALAGLLLAVGMLRRSRS